MPRRIGETIKTTIASLAADELEQLIEEDEIIQYAISIMRMPKPAPKKASPSDLLGLVGLAIT
jgi:hypothetical protein